MGDARTPRRRERKPASCIAALPPRMQQVAALLGAGATNHEIAGRLGVGVKTVDTHRHEALRRLGLRNNADLARAAIREGVISMHDDEQAEGAPDHG